MDAGFLADDLGGEGTGEDADAELAEVQADRLLPNGLGLQEENQRLAITLPLNLHRAHGRVGGISNPTDAGVDREPIGVDKNGQIAELQGHPGLIGGAGRPGGVLTGNVYDQRHIILGDQHLAGEAHVGVAGNLLGSRRRGGRRFGDTPVEGCLSGALWRAGVLKAAQGRPRRPPLVRLDELPHRGILAQQRLYFAQIIRRFAARNQRRVIRLPLVVFARLPVRARLSAQPVLVVTHQIVHLSGRAAWIIEDAEVGDRDHLLKQFLARRIRDGRDAPEAGLGGLTRPAKSGQPVRAAAPGAARARPAAQ